MIADVQHAFGQFASIMSAVTFAAAMVFYRKSGEHAPPIAVNLFKNVVAILLFGATLAVRPAGLDQMLGWERDDYLTIVFSAIVGVALADTLFIYAINQLGVGLMSVIDCLYSTSTFFFAWILLGERMTWLHYVGAALVIAGIVVSSFHAPPEGRTRGQVLRGVIGGAAAATMMGLGITIAKPLIECSPVAWVTLLRLVIATVVLGLIAGASRDRARIFGVFRPSRQWLNLIAAAVLATYLCMAFWHAGFKYADASVAAILNQTSTIFAILFATLFLHERLTKRKITSVTLAFVGVATVILADPLLAWL